MSGDIRNRDAAAGAPQPLLSPIRDFDRVGRLAIATTAITGGVVAWAPGIPEPVRDQVLLAVLVCWTLTVFLATFSLLLAPDSERGAQSRAPWHLIGVIGIGVALVTASELWLVRRLCKLGGLTWNVDWRWAWGQAKTIARFGDLERSLAYAGEAVHYHAGPPWLAAAAQRVFGFGLEDVLFGLLPGLTVLSTVIALVLLLSGQG